MWRVELEQQLDHELTTHRNMHCNAKLTPRGRAEMVRCVIDQGLAVKLVAANFYVSERTVCKWVKRQATTTGWRIAHRGRS